MEIAELLKLDEINASNLFTLANSNEQLLKAIQSATKKSTNNFNLCTIEAWKLLRNELVQVTDAAKSLPEVTTIESESVQELTETTEPTVTEQPNVSETVLNSSSDITDTVQTTFEVVEQPPLIMPVDDPWLTEQPEVNKSNDQVTYSIISIIPNKPEETLLTTTSLNVLREKAKTLPGYYRIEKFQDGESFTINLSELTNVSETTVKSPVTASVEIPEQVQQASVTVVETTETTNEVDNSYAFSFQETKLPITVLEIHSLDNKRIEVVNLQDAYFVELRDDKLYVSYGLPKTFHSSKYRIIKAFNSLLNGSNFIHLRDKRENNRDILVNLNRVKTIEQNSKFIKFHWNGWLTVPGVHKLSDWQVVD